MNNNLSNLLSIRTHTSCNINTYACTCTHSHTQMDKEHLSRATIHNQTANQKVEFVKDSCTCTPTHTHTHTHTHPALILRTLCLRLTSHQVLYLCCNQCVCVCLCTLPCQQKSDTLNNMLHNTMWQGHYLLSCPHTTLLPRLKYNC